MRPISVPDMTPSKTRDTDLVFSSTAKYGEEAATRNPAESNPAKAMRPKLKLLSHNPSVLAT